MGLEHGAFCVGCCWVLMALLLVGGVMNVFWVASLRFCPCGEVAPAGIWVSRVAGVALDRVGVATLMV